MQTKKISYLKWFACAATILGASALSSCSKDEDSGTENKTGLPSVYSPYDGKKVSKIEIESSKSGSKSELLFSYDSFGRISSFTKKGETYSFQFNDTVLVVKKDNSNFYQCNFNAEGYISAVTSKNVAFTYNADSLLTRCSYGTYYFTIKYNSQKNQTEVSTYTTSTPSTQYYTYSSYENKTNIDLNAIISSVFPYEAWFGDNGVLSPFSLFGKRSPYLISREVYNSQHTYDVSYEVDAEKYPTKITVKDNATVNNNGTSTYSIIYE